MCGIVGVIDTGSVGTVNRKNYFEQGLYVDAVRGWDSTGIFAVSNQKDVWMYKRAMTSADFLNMRPYENVMGKYHTYKAVIGHNRKATKGGVLHRNAHPFNFDHITMVHNGTLDFHKTTLPDGDKFVVDSEALAYSIATIGAQETFEIAEGAFACVWYDENEDSINLIRNEERPLNYAICNDGVLIASEKLMLMWLADRNNLEIKELVSLPAGLMTTFKGDMRGKPRVKQVKITDPYYGNVSNSGWSKTQGFHQVGTASSKDTKSNIIVLDSDDEREKQAKKRELVQTRRLAYHELKLNETIVIDAVGFVPYEKQHQDIEDPLGRMDGLHCFDGDALLVECHGMRESAYQEETSYQGKLIALRAGENESEDVLIAHDVKPLNADHTLEDEEIPGEDDDGLDGFDPNDPDTWDDVDWDTVDEDVFNAQWGAANEETEEELRFPSPSGRLVSETTFKALTEDGCQFCGGFINPNYADDIGWIDGGHGGGVVCHECYPTYRHYGVFNGQIQEKLH